MESNLQPIMSVNDIVTNEVPFDKRYARNYYDDLCQAIRWIKKLDERLNTLHPQVSRDVKNLEGTRNGI